MSRKRDRAEYMKRYAEENRQRLREYHRKYREENRERIRACSAEAEKRARDRYRNNRRRWQEENAEARREYLHDWRAGNRERINSYQKEWRQTPKGQVVARAHGERRKGARLDLETRRWADTLLLDPCVYCGGSSDTVDHIVPFVDGGGNEWDNLAPACRSCNSSKNVGDLLSFLLRRISA